MQHACVTQEVCFTQTFPPWSVMTLDTSRRYSGQASAAEEADRGDDVIHSVNESHRILVRKGCVDRSVRSSPTLFDTLIKIYLLTYLLTSLRW